MITGLYNSYRMNQARRKTLHDVDRFLTRVEGIIHVGAHRGGERHLYGSLDLNVVWIEADPKIFAKLKKNVSGYPKQIAINVLVSDGEKSNVAFNRASNSGGSSSMLEFQDHAVQYPDIKMVDQIFLPSKSLTKIAADEGFELSKYKGLIVDVQGAELLVLKGLGKSLSEFDYVKLESSDFPAYAGGVMIKELSAFMGANGFTESSRNYFGGEKPDGNYFDVLYTAT